MSRERVVELYVDALQMSGKDISWMDATEVTYALIEWALIPCREKDTTTDNRYSQRSI